MHDGLFVQLSDKFMKARLTSKANTWWDTGMSRLLLAGVNTAERKKMRTDLDATISNGFTNCGHQRDDQLMTPN